MPDETRVLITVHKAIMALIADFSNQAVEIIEIIDKLNPDEKAMTDADWVVVNRILEKTRAYTKTAIPALDGETVSFKKGQM